MFLRNARILPTLIPRHPESDALLRVGGNLQHARCLRRMSRRDVVRLIGQRALLPDVARGQMAARIIQFISRRTPLRLREARRIAERVNRYGQYVPPTAAENEQIQQDQLEQRHQDWAWSQRHGRMVEGAVVVPFRNDPVVELTPCDLAEGREEFVK